MRAFGFGDCSGIFIVPCVNFDNAYSLLNKRQMYEVRSVMSNLLVFVIGGVQKARTYDNRRK